MFVRGAEAGHEIPKALWIFGPPAVGKTTISNEAASDIFGRADNAVRVGDLVSGVLGGQYAFSAWALTGS